MPVAVIPEAGAWSAFRRQIVSVEPQELVVTEIGFNLVDTPKFAGIRLGQQFYDWGLPSPLMPHPENQARFTTKANGLLGVALFQGQRLFAKDMLAGRDSSLNLRAVQCMRRGQHDGFYVGIGQRILVVGRQSNTLFGANRARCLEIRLNGAHYTDV
jgi:hypothetical protein